MRGYSLLSLNPWHAPNLPGSAGEPVVELWDLVLC